MFKSQKYVILCLTVICLSLNLISCKSKKAVAPATSNLPRSEEESAAAKSVRFDRMYVDACAERMKGNLQEALILFEKCKTMDPANPAVRYELGMIYKLLGNKDLALANAKICAAADLKNEWYQLLLIECYNSVQQYNQGIKVREVLVKNFPAKSEFKEDLAIEYALVGQYEKSFRLYEELEKNYGIHEQITLNKVKLLKSLKKQKEAEEELIKLSNSNKNEPRYYNYLAEFYLEQNELEKAKKMYDNIIAVDPDNTTVNLALHDYYTAKGQDKEAFEYLKKAFQNPELEVYVKADILRAIYKRASYQSREDFTKGKELADIMLNVHPKAAESNILYADFLMLERNAKEASRYYYLATLSEKRDFRTWENLMVADNETGQYDSLEHHSATAMELFPNQPQAYLYNGVANTQLKNFKKAAQSLKDGQEFVIDNKSQMLDFYRSLGDVYFYLKDYSKSDKAFEDALKIDSDNTYVLNNYAYFLSLRNENLEKAERFSRKANELKQNERGYMDTYGWILFQQQKYTEAEQWLSRAAKGSFNATILEHYGDVLYKLNKKEEAVLQWEAARKAGNNSESLLKKIKEKALND